MTDARWDGNAAAGDLGDFFVPEMTLAVTTCATCGAHRALGELRVYLRAPGLVLRCTTCDAVQIRVVRGVERAWLDLSGLRMLQVELPAGTRAGGGSE
jgi:Family of unknown function (DUF6510)